MCTAQKLASGEERPAQAHFIAEISYSTKHFVSPQLSVLLLRRLPTILSQLGLAIMHTCFLFIRLCEPS